MKINVEFSYKAGNTEVGKGARKRAKETIEVEIREPSEAEFPIAGIVHYAEDGRDDCVLRYMDGKLWREAWEAGEPSRISRVFPRPCDANAVPSDEEIQRDYKLAPSRGDDREAVVESLLAYYADYAVFDGKVWETSWEPSYWDSGKDVWVSWNPAEESQGIGLPNINANDVALLHGRSLRDEIEVLIPWAFRYGRDDKATDHELLNCARSVWQGGFGKGATPMPPKLIGPVIAEVGRIARQRRKPMHCAGEGDVREAMRRVIARAFA